MEDSQKMLKLRRRSEKLVSTRGVGQQAERRCGGGSRLIVDFLKRQERGARGKA
jgi:hypothetical protein